MPPLLSGNTLGLKFMQRGAAAKAAATEARRQEEAKKQAEAREEAVRKRDSSSSEADSDSSVEEDDGREDNEVRGPVASTSRLPARHQPSISTEHSYLAFPILSSAYGVASTSQMSGNVNGRLSFGKVSKKEKQRQVEDDAEPSFDDNDDSHPRRAVPGKSGRKEKKIYSISSGGAGVPDGSSIRQQQRARAAAEAGRRRDSSAMSKSDEEDPAGDVKYEEDTNFVDEMMIQARQKRQMDASHNGRKKKRKSAV